MESEEYLSGARPVAAGYVVAIDDLIQTSETRFGAFVCDGQIALNAFGSGNVKDEDRRVFD